MRIDHPKLVILCPHPRNLKPHGIIDSIVAIATDHAISFSMAASITPNNSRPRSRSTLRSQSSLLWNRLLLWNRMRKSRGLRGMAVIFPCRNRCSRSGSTPASTRRIARLPNRPAYTSMMIPCPGMRWRRRRRKRWIPRPSIASARSGRARKRVRVKRRLSRPTRSPLTHQWKLERRAPSPLPPARRKPRVRGAWSRFPNRPRRRTRRRDGSAVLPPGFSSVKARAMAWPLLQRGRLSVASRPGSAAYTAGSMRANVNMGRRSVTRRSYWKINRRRHRPRHRTPCLRLR